MILQTPMSWGTMCTGNRVFSGAKLIASLKFNR